MSRIGWISVVMACSLLACKRDDLPFFKGGKNLVMVKSWEGQVAHSYTQQGVLANSSVTIAVPFLLLGRDDSDTAVHYVIRYKSDDLRIVGFPGREFRVNSVFNRDKAIDTLFLEFTRDSAYMDTVYTLHIFLETSAKYNTQLEHPDELGFARHLEVRIEDQFEEPAWWDEYEGYFGAFSSRKMRMIGRLFELDLVLLPLYFNYWIKDQNQFYPIDFGMAFRQFLEQQAALGNPVYERDGKLMRAGEKVYN